MSKIPGSAHANLSIGGAVILGGAYGYMKKGSTVSLVAGLGVGSLLLGSSYLIASTDRVYEGHLLGSTAGGLLMTGMGHRFVSTGKFMPAGMVAVLGAAACAYNVHKAREWAPSSKQGEWVVRKCCAMILTFWNRIMEEKCKAK